MNRRQFLKTTAVAGLAQLLPPGVQALHALEIPAEKSLSFYNLHTCENLKTVYWADNAYRPEALSQINHILRDYRTGGIKPIAVSLLDLLYDITRLLKTEARFQVISGYRSPETNAMLASRSNLVDKNSLHMQGKAIDINLEGQELSTLRTVAMNLARGGVGLYRKTNFVHVDVGRVRFW